MPKSTHWTACTAQRENGSFCDAPTIAGAPFPICVRHAAQLYQFMRERVADVAADPDTALDVAVAVSSRSKHYRADRDFGDAGTVYYLQVGQLIKIGVAGNVRTRLKNYPPNRRLLATEPGGYLRETQRLAEFATFLHAGREWFTPGAELVEHINRLRRGNGARPFRA